MYNHTPDFHAWESLLLVTYTLLFFFSVGWGRILEINISDSGGTGEQSKIMVRGGRNMGGKGWGGYTGLYDYSWHAVEVKEAYFSPRTSIPGQKDTSLLNARHHHR